MTAPVLEGARWSSAVSCARRAVYEGIGAPMDTPTTDQMKAWRRGRIIGEAIATELVVELRALGQRPRREEEVRWPREDPIGTGHADLWIPAEALVIEVVSTRGCDLPERKAVQVSGYAINKPGAERAMVVSVDPMTGDQKRYPVDFDGHRDLVAEIEQRVVAGVRAGGKAMPPRVCQHPRDEPTRWCPFVGHCFAGWAAEMRDSLIGDPTPLVDLADAIDRRKAIEDDLKVAKAAEDDAREVVRAILPDGGEIAGGGITVKRSKWTEERFSLSDYRKAGRTVTRAMRPYIGSTERDRLTVKRMEES